jgi:hypothetical protein
MHAGIIRNRKINDSTPCVILPISILNTELINKEVNIDIKIKIMLVQTPIIYPVILAGKRYGFLFMACSRVTNEV